MKYQYGKHVAEVTSADGVQGILLYCSAEQRHFFRVYAGDHTFTDYDIRHDDLAVTISADALASFYCIGETRLLDHSPQVLGLTQSS